MEAQNFTNVGQIFIKSNREVKFLPKNMGTEFSDLKDFWAKSCGLTVVRDFYFKSMKNLEFLVLSENKIVVIESDAFRDLISLEKLWLQNNMIQTFDVKLFTTMVSIKEIYLGENKIKFLSASTFLNVGGKLAFVGLKDNICINENYRSDSNMEHLESNLRDYCKQKARVTSTNGKFTQILKC